MLIPGIDLCGDFVPDVEPRGLSRRRGREEIGVWGVEKGFDHRTGLGIRVELGVGIGVRVGVRG